MTSLLLTPSKAGNNALETLPMHADLLADLRSRTAGSHLSDRSPRLFLVLQAKCLRVLAMTVVGLISCAPLASFALHAQEPSDGTIEKTLADHARLQVAFDAAVESGKGEEAIALAREGTAVERRLLELVRRRAPDDKLTHSRILNSLVARETWLAETYDRKDDFSAARTARAAILQLLQELHGPEDWRVTDARLSLEDVDIMARLSEQQRRQLRESYKQNARSQDLFRQGRREEAVESAKQVVALYQALLGEKHTHFSESLFLLATFHSDMGEYGLAEPLYRKSLEINQALLGDDHLVVAMNLNSLALLYRRRGNYAKAEPLYHRALELSSKLLGEKHSGVAKCLGNLATLLQDQGEYSQAEPLFRQAAEINKVALGERHPEYATSLNNLAVLYGLQGNLVRQHPLYRQALEIRRAVLGDKHPHYANSLFNLALHYQAQGDFARAEPLYVQALEINRVALGDGHPDYAVCLNGLAAFYYLRDDLIQADSYYRRAVEVQTAVFGKGHPEYGTSLNNLALLRQSQERYAEAEALFREALSVYKAALGEKHAKYAASLNNLAALYTLQGDFTKAEPVCREALEINRTMLGESHLDYAANLSNLAILQRGKGDHAAAEPLFRRVLGLSHAQLQHCSVAQSERQQLRMSSILRIHLDAYLSLAIDTPQYGESCYRDMLRSKGIVWMRQRQLRAMADEPSLAPAFKDLQSVATRLATLAISTPLPHQQNAWRQQVNDLSLRKDELERELMGQSARYRESKKEVTLEAIQASMPEPAALLDFLEFTYFRQPPQGEMKRFVTERRLVVFVLRKGEPLASLDLGPIQPLADAIDTWRRTFGRGAQGVAAGRLLREKVWLPVEAKLGDAKLVLVSPDGALGRLPLAALPGREPGTYLLEDWSIASLPVPQALPELLSETEPGSQPEGFKSVLLVGGIDYAAAEMTTAPRLRQSLAWAQRGAEWRQFDPLEGTVGEISTIAGMHREHFGPEDLTSLDKRQASEARFRVEAPRHRHLHLATHGFFAPPELRSALAPPRNGTVNLADGPQLSGHQPSLLSGLAFAGANGRPQEDSDDGILTAEEVQAIDLRRVQLATLSACETGLGEVAGGEGVLGLQRAFQLAGARTTVTSLWKVDDDYTRALMEQFYHNLWAKKMTKLEALREAQLWLLRDAKLGSPRAGTRALVRTKPVDPDDKDPRLPPFYWAAFVLAGDWR